MSYIINDTIAVDAGSIGFYRSAIDQMAIQHVLISHTHMDHVASLPIFLENVYNDSEDCVTVYGSRYVLDCLQKDFFNGRIWPDFIAMSAQQSAFLRTVTLDHAIAQTIGDVKITPILVDHTVPTFGFVIEEPGASILIVSDTGPTVEIWNWANRLPNLKGVFLEVSFPDSLDWLAEISKHLTPSKFLGEVQKLNTQVPIVAVHIKSRFHDQVVKEMHALGLANLIIGTPGQDYDFS